MTQTTNMALRMATDNRHRTALVMGYVCDFDYLVKRRRKDESLRKLEIKLEQLIYDLIEGGIRNFIFLHWGRFEQMFLYILRVNQIKLGEVYASLFIEEDTDKIVSPLFSRCFFDRVVNLGQEPFCLEEEQVFEQILSSCCHVVHYNIISPSIWSERLGKALAAGKKLIDVETWMP